MYHGITPIIIARIQAKSFVISRGQAVDRKLRHFSVIAMSSNGTSNGGASNGPIPNGTAAVGTPAGVLPPSTVGGAAASTASGTAAPGPPIADFMTQLEDYSPTIPDAVTQHFLSTAGFETNDPRIVKLVSLASQKFISDIANDALQHCKMRNAGQASNKKGKDRKHTMTTEDLSQALSDQGITLKKPPYYV